VSLLKVEHAYSEPRLSLCSPLLGFGGPLLKGVQPAVVVSLLLGFSSDSSRLQDPRRAATHWIHILEQHTKYEKMIGDASPRTTDR
jgi:hypothetical protein